MKKTTSRYVICVKTEGADDLEVRKLYRVLPDDSASAQGHFRIIDESGVDYLYPEEWLVTVEIPEDVQRALAAASPGPTRAR